MVPHLNPIEIDDGLPVDGTKVEEDPRGTTAILIIFMIVKHEAVPHLLDDRRTRLVCPPAQTGLDRKRHQDGRVEGTRPNGGAFFSADVMAGSHS
jgi:hypothetical protein